MKLDQEDVTRICQRVVDRDMDTCLVAEQFEISRRRVQQLAKEYRDRGAIPQLETLGRKPFAEYPDGLEHRILEVRQRRGAGAEAIRYRFSGTHEAEIMGIPPTGKAVETAGIVIFRLEDGQIAEAWAVDDVLELRQRLGESS